MKKINKELSPKDTTITHYIPKPTPIKDMTRGGR